MIDIALGLPSGTAKDKIEQQKELIFMIYKFIMQFYNRKLEWRNEFIKSNIKNFLWINQYVKFIIKESETMNWEEQQSETMNWEEQQNKTMNWGGQQSETMNWEEQQSNFTMIITVMMMKSKKNWRRIKILDKL